MIESGKIELKNHIEQTITPIMICLLEQINMQMAAEEQDYLDRDLVALYGV